MAILSKKNKKKQKKNKKKKKKTKKKQKKKKKGYLCKTFCVFILIMHILFCCRNQKNVLLKEIKDQTFEAYLLIGEPSS